MNVVGCTETMIMNGVYLHSIQSELMNRNDDLRDSDVHKHKI